MTRESSFICNFNFCTFKSGTPIRNKIVYYGKSD